MGQSNKEPLEGKTPSAKSLNELMELLLKLNAKLRERISPRSKKEEREKGNTEMVVIILSHSPRNVPKTPRPGKTKPQKDGWIESLCQEIEDGFRTGKNS